MIRYMINDFFGSTFDSTFGSTLYSFFLLLRLTRCLNRRHRPVVNGIACLGASCDLFLCVT
jgi:hypothetical protein